MKMNQLDDAGCLQTSFGRSLRRAAIRGATLIEIMTVAAIVALLGALIMPSVGKVRQKAASARCLNNLRQIGVALANWTADNDGRMVYSWYDDRPEYVGKPWALMLDGYLGPVTGNKIWVCPSQPHRTKEEQWPKANPPWAGFTTSVDYAQNIIGGTWPGRPPAPPQRIVAAQTAPSRLVYLIEGRNVFWDQNSWNSAVAPYLNAHGKGASALFLDYHVELLPGPTFTQVRDASFDR